jgi:hypothetical protein
MPSVCFPVCRWVVQSCSTTVAVWKLQDLRK